MSGARTTTWSTRLLIPCVALAAACGDSETPPPQSACATGATCIEADAAPVVETPDPVFDAAAAIDASVTSSSDLPCDVRKVLETHCASCHSAEGLAPMALAMRADFQATAPKAPEKTVAASVAERIHSTDSKAMMPPAGYDRLSSDELATLDGWLEAGTPAGEATCETDSQPDASVDDALPEDVECVRFLAHDLAGKEIKYKVGVAWDVYVNMTFKATWTGTRYAVMARPVVDNKKVIHHWLLFQNSLPGIDGAIAPAVGAHPDGALLVGWAPGGEGLDLRKQPDVGMELPGGDQTYTIEFHYNSDDPAAEDASGVELCMRTEKPKNIASVSWLGKDQLAPSDKWTATCAPLSLEPIHILSVSPHMHLAGKHMKATINRKDGTKEILHDAPFDFEYQRNYAKDVTLMPGDTITTECSYSKLTWFGKSTNEEMCYLFTYAYPKGALANLDPWGAFAHGGSSCLGL